MTFYILFHAFTAKNINKKAHFQKISLPAKKQNCAKLTLFLFFFVFESDRYTENGINEFYTFSNIQWQVIYFHWVVPIKKSHRSIIHGWVFFLTGFPQQRKKKEKINWTFSIYSMDFKWVKISKITAFW